MRDFTHLASSASLDLHCIHVRHTERMENGIGAFVEAGRAFLADARQRNTGVLANYLSEEHAPVVEGIANAAGKPGRDIEGGLFGGEYRVWRPNLPLAELYDDFERVLDRLDAIDAAAQVSAADYEELRAFLAAFFEAVMNDAWRRIYARNDRRYLAA